MATLLLLICSLPMWGQLFKEYPPRPWMFTLEKQVSAPELSAEEIKERFEKFLFREPRENRDAFKHINWQTNRINVLYAPPFVDLFYGRRKYSALLTYDIAVIPGNGYYTIQLQRVEASVYRGRFRVFGDTIRSDNDTGPEVHAGKRAKMEVPIIVKEYMRGEFEKKCLRIENYIRNPEIDFFLSEE